MKNEGALAPSAEIRSLIIKSYELLNGRFVCGPQCLRRTSKIKQNRKKKDTQRKTNDTCWDYFCQSKSLFIEVCSTD